MKPLQEMTVNELFRNEGFINITKNKLKDLVKTRKDARDKAYRKGLCLKAHPIDSLCDEGYFQIDKFIETFKNVLERNTPTLSSSQRNYIREIGMECGRKTMKKLLKDEQQINTERKKT
ncbi:MAG: hypothetical protein LBP67_05085 [Bacteroidales bacterium]|jgi:hypothetical protein|nr:hypothetical protein [Bacteroidales bacterium]